MTVVELTNTIGMDEFSGWMAFYAEKVRLQQVESGNLAVADDETILKGFGL
jgi:hypothetical protein